MQAEAAFKEMEEALERKQERERLNKEKQLQSYRSRSQSPDKSVSAVQYPLNSDNESSPTAAPSFAPIQEQLLYLNN